MPAQYRAIWSVPGGGTGYTVLHFQNAGSGTVAQDIADAVHDFFDAWDGNLPNDVTISFDSEVIDMTSAGVLTDVWAVTPGAPLTGAWTGSWSKAQGLRIDWITNNIVVGRRLTGRTFLVPVAGTMFENNGDLTSAAVAAFQGFGDDLITATSAFAPLHVWSRTHTTSVAVEACAVPSKGAILRTRRD